MKKLALAICLLVVSIAAQAQFEKGKMILNPSVTGLDFSYSKNDKAKFGIGAQAGTFLADGIALMVILYWQATLSNRDRKSTRLNSSHIQKSRMPSSA